MGNAARNHASYMPSNAISLRRRTSRQDKRPPAEPGVAGGIDKKLKKARFIRHRSKSAEYPGLYERQRRGSNTRYGCEIESERISQEAHGLAIAYRADSHGNAASRSKYRICSHDSNIHRWPCHAHRHYRHLAPACGAGLHIQDVRRHGASYMLGCHYVLATVHFDGKRRTGSGFGSNLKCLPQDFDRHRVCRVRPNSLLVHARLFLMPFARSRSLGSTQEPRSQKPCPGNLQA